MVNMLVEASLAVVLFSRPAPTCSLPASSTSSHSPAAVSVTIPAWYLAQLLSGVSGWLHELFDAVVGLVCLVFGFLASLVFLLTFWHAI